VDHRQPQSTRFRYAGFAIDEQRGEVACRYLLDDRPFVERIAVAGPGEWGSPGVAEAARLVYLLAGVSYYKAGAPPVIELADTPVREGEVDFLRDFYRFGLGEFAYRNGLRVAPALTGGRPAGAPAAGRADPERPLVPFGGGIDSIVTVEWVRRVARDPALFVVNAAGDHFAAIDAAVAVTGLPLVGAERTLDPAILRSQEFGFLNGHVPVTGIVSAIGVLAATLDGRGAVVMSNEWSTSLATLTAGGEPVNHQWSKSAAFEDGFRAVLAGAFADPPEYFSLLRARSDLWIAQRFAALDAYLPFFRSCNRSFHIDPASRLPRWCGRCDKCCYVDLILAPFLPAERLVAIFGGHEPLAEPALLETFATLLDVSGTPKPFECVGDAAACRAAAVLAARRADRAGQPVLAALVEHLPAAAREAALAPSLAPFAAPLGPDHVPRRYAAEDLLV
jgi:hypothetical protein